MAHARRYLIFVWVWMVLTHPPARAQADASRAEEITFTVFAQQRPMGLQFFPAMKQAPQSLEFFGNARSPIYTYRGGAQVPFYDGAELTAWWEARERDPRNALDMPGPVAVAQVGPGIARALFIFIPVRNPRPGEPRFRVQVVDDSPRRLPAGYASVINASGREYVAKVGGRSLEVPLGVGGKVPVKGTVELRLAAQSGEGWVVSGRHTFRLGEGERVSLVFFPPSSPTGIAPIIRTLVEKLPVETAAETSVTSEAR